MRKQAIFACFPHIGGKMKRKSFLDEKYRPTGQGVLKESKIAIALGGIAIVIFAVLIQLSYRQSGNAGRWIGFLGWVLILTSVIGEYYAVSGFSEPGGSTIAKMIGVVLNGLIIIAMIFTFVIGIL